MPKADTEISSCFFLRMAPDIQVWSGDRQASDLDFLSSLIFVRERRRHAAVGHNRKINQWRFTGRKLSIVSLLPPMAATVITIHFNKAANLLALDLLTFPQSLPYARPCQTSHCEVGSIVPVP